MAALRTNVVPIRRTHTSLPYTSIYVYFHAYAYQKISSIVVPLLVQSGSGLWPCRQASPLHTIEIVRSRDPITEHSTMLHIIGINQTIDKRARRSKMCTRGCANVNVWRNKFVVKTVGFRQCPSTPRHKMVIVTCSSLFRNSVASCSPANLRRNLVVFLFTAPPDSSSIHHNLSERCFAFAFSTSKDLHISTHHSACQDLLSGTCFTNTSASLPSPATSCAVRMSCFDICCTHIVCVCVLQDVLLFSQVQLAVRLPAHSGSLSTAPGCAVSQVSPSSIFLAHVPSTHPFVIAFASASADLNDIGG